MSSLGQANSAEYIELIAYLLEDKNFRNEQEIEDVVKSLITKSVLEFREEEWIFGDNKVSVKVLAFIQDNLCKKLYEAS
ncbi:MAG TPA: hypothetical protein VJ772_06045 [Nitrososphaeraceae archaeon]|nr:hypothetical protein [Nitrososphaeraceae archaeon]